VWKEEGLKKDVVVRPDGGLSFPLIGEVEAAGKSIAQLRTEIGQRLEKYIPDPVVAVAINKVASQRVYVIGKVNKPGEFVIGRPIDVLQALSMAGGLTPFAASNDIKIVRRQGGRNLTLPFRYSDIERGQRLEQNIVLQPGDVVVVP
jgi:polysaccharide export outer membrane protein